MEPYVLSCWFCTCEYDAAEASFCNHIDPTLICPFCLKCACDAPEEYKNEFLKKCPKNILEEKLILESRTSLKLGEMLIRAGKITRPNLLLAIEKQKTFKKRIGEIFVMMNLLTPDELSIYLAEQQGIEKIDLRNYDIDFELIEKIGRPFCLKNKIIPIEYYETNKEKILRFVIHSKEDLVKLKTSKELKNFVLIPYHASPKDMKRLFQQIIDYDVMVLK